MKDDADQRNCELSKNIITGSNFFRLQIQNDNIDKDFMYQEVDVNLFCIQPCT